MTENEIIDLAKQAGMIPLKGSVNALGKSVPLDWLIDFAKLIAEKERKEWAREFAGMGEWTAVHMLEERGQE